MPVADNTILLEFAAQGCLALLEPLRPLAVTRGLLREFELGAPEASIRQLHAGIARGWLQELPSPRGEQAEAVRSRARGLSRLDEDLVILARQHGEELFTDDPILGAFADAEGVIVLNLVEVWLLLEELGTLDETGLKQMAASTRGRRARENVAPPPSHALPAEASRPKRA